MKSGDSTMVYWNHRVISTYPPQFRKPLCNLWVSTTVILNHHVIITFNDGLRKPSCNLQLKTTTIPDFILQNSSAAVKNSLETCENRSSATVQHRYHRQPYQHSLIVIINMWLLTFLSYFVFIVDILDI